MTLENIGDEILKVNIGMSFFAWSELKYLVFWVAYKVINPTKL